MNRTKELIQQLSEYLCLNGRRGLNFASINLKPHTVEERNVLIELLEQLGNIGIDIRIIVLPFLYSLDEVKANSDSTFIWEFNGRLDYLSIQIYKEQRDFLYKNFPAIRNGIYNIMRQCINKYNQPQLICRVYKNGNGKETQI